MLAVPVNNSRFHIYIPGWAVQSSHGPKVKRPTLQKKWPFWYFSYSNSFGRGSAPRLGNLGGVMFFKILAITLACGVSHAAYLSESINLNSTTVHTMTDIKTSIKKSRLISIGESHQSGIERELLKEIYLNLFSAITKKANCLIEDVDNLFPTQDLVRPVVLNGCNKVINVTGNSPATTGYSVPLKDNLKLDRIVITHSGFRHIMPMGVLFPGDFQATKVDTQAKNTVITQIEDKYLETLVHTSLTPVNRDDLAINQVRSELQKVLPASSSNNLPQKISALLAAVKANMESPRLKFESSEQVRLIKIQSMQSKLNPVRESYLAIIDHKVLDLKTLEMLLKSQELISFLKAFTSSTPLYMSVAYTEMGFDGDTLIAKGGLLLFGSKGHIAINPDGKITLKIKP